MKQIKFGGVQFAANVPPQEINKFVRELPKDKKDSLYEVIKELADNNLINLEGFEYPQDEDC